LHFGRAKAHFGALRIGHVYPIPARSLQLIGLVYSAITAIAATALSLQIVSAAPVSTIDPQSADLVAPASYSSEASSAVENSTPAVESPKQSEIAPPSEELLPTGSVAGWFAGGGTELGFSDDKSALQIDPAACLYLDSYLRSARGERDDCRILTPGDDSKILTLPYLALSAWVLVVIAAAGVYHLYRRYRVRRWLHQLRGRGLAPPVASRRVQVARRSRRLRSRGRSRGRSYAS
jgi:hypothetical protein